MKDHPLSTQLERRELVTKSKCKTGLTDQGVECDKAVCKWQQKDVKMQNSVVERSLDYSWLDLLRVKLVTNSSE